MYEVERKARVPHRKLRDRLDELDTEPIETVVQTDTYLNHPGRDFAETDEALRLRRVTQEAETGENRTSITYKGPQLERESKARIELETTIDDYQAALEILEALGFTPVATVTKHRTRYPYEGVTICLDDVEGLGEFVELELETHDPAEAESRLSAVCSDLSIGSEETFTTPYLTMILQDEDSRSP